MTTRTPNWRRLQKKLIADLKRPCLQQLADEWGLPPKVLQRLGVGWSERRQAYTFPERDHAERITGMMYRDAKTGGKRMITGSTRGVYVIKGWQDMEGPILLPEGVSDTAVLLAHGLAAVGRPSCKGGVEVLAELFRGIEHDVMVVGENDQKDGKWPGRDGAETTAEKLADLLGREVRWTLPPDGFKDVREWFHQGGDDGR